MSDKTSKNTGKKNTASQSAPQYKEGDLVVLYIGNLQYIKRVEKVTPSGAVRVDGKLFKDGRCRRTSWDWDTIEPATTEHIAALEVRKWKMGLAKELVGKNLMPYDYSTLKEVARLLKLESYRASKTLDEKVRKLFADEARKEEEWKEEAQKVDTPEDKAQKDETDKPETPEADKTTEDKETDKEATK